MFDVKQAAARALPPPVLNTCALCEHRHPQGCNFCDLDVEKPKNDPWWPREDVRERVNVASGEDVTC